MRMTTRFLTLALLFVPIFFVGCDTIEDAAGLDNVDVALGSTGSLDVAPDSTTRSSGSVTIDEDIPGSPGVEDISVLAENVTFTPAAAPRGAATSAVTFHFWVLVDDVPAVSGSIDIDDSYAVTDVSTAYTAEYTVAQICAGYPANACPVSSVLPSDEIDGAVTASLNSGEFTVDIILQNPSNLQGTFVISELQFDLNL